LEANRIREVIVHYLSSISDRERKILFFGIPILLISLYLTVIILPILETKERYREKEELLIKKVEKLKPQVEELILLQEEIKPVLRKVKRGSELDVVSYVKTVARMVGLEIKGVKLLPGTTENGIEVDTVSVSFKEQPLNKVSRFLFKLETSSYYFKTNTVKLSDYDENGLVSGKATLYFFRGEK